MSSSARFDPVRLEVMRHAFASVADEMGAALMRTGFSANIKERRDYSCALFDSQGRAVAQGDHMPVHLGSMQASVAAALAWGPLEEGDVVALNDPYEGGTHLPDLTLVGPTIFAGDGPLFYLATRAHHSDMGGATPGSMGLASEIVAEGLRIPPVRLYRRGQPVEDVLRLVLANLRDPVEREGDLAAQLASLHVGRRGVEELAHRYGTPALLRDARDLMDYSERMTRAALQRLEPGTYDYSDTLDDVGPLQARVTVASPARRGVAESPELEVDLREVPDAVPLPVNCPRAVTLSAVGYVIRCIAGASAPWNDGTLRPVRVLTRSGSLFDVAPPFPVAGGNVETSQRIVDLVLGSLASALPGRIPASSQGTMNNLCLGGTRRDGARWSYYETIAGGAGGGPRRRGESGIHTHMTNSRNTPVEALEHLLPLRVRRYHLRSDSGGAGQHRGGEGVVREIEALEPVSLTLLSERRRVAPPGLAGGGAASAGAAFIVRADGAIETLGGHDRAQLEPGDRVRIETPGGGGWGTP